jgi:hypothetical protein
MKTKLMIPIVAAIISLLVAGCASKPVVLPPVGPAPENQTYIPAKGYLRVFSDTEPHEIGENFYYYPHKSYLIYTESGQQFKYVANHVGDMDESPARVSIPAGRYYVLADSSSYGRVKVPVIIEAGRMTVVHLDSAWRSSRSRQTGVVRLPNGEPVGWGVSNETPPDENPANTKS